MLESVLTFLAALTQTRLHLGIVALEVVVHDVEVLKGRELVVCRQWRLDKELNLATAGAQPVTRVDAQLLAHALDHSAYLGLEILRIVDYVEVRMTNPGSRSLIVEFAGEFHAFRTTCVLFRGVEFFGAIRRRHHVDDLVVPVEWIMLSVLESKQVSLVIHHTKTRFETEYSLNYGFITKYYHKVKISMHLILEISFVSFSKHEYLNF